MSHWCVDDLVILRDAGVKIDTDIFAEVFNYENRNYLSVVRPCHECGAPPLAQHSLTCSHATILVCDDWYERLKTFRPANVAKAQTSFPRQSAEL